MKFVHFASNRLQELAQSCQAAPPEKYPLWKEAEAKAIGFVTCVIQCVYRVLNVPIVVLKYFAVQIGLLPAPRPVLEEANHKKAEERAVMQQIAREAAQKATGTAAPKPH